MNVRKRIVARRTIRAGDLKPHPLNWRTHPDGQRAAVTALYEEVGEVRSLLVYIADSDKPAQWTSWTSEARRLFVNQGLADDKFTLIDGHGRREWLPDEQLDVEVTDLNDEEARKVLLSLDATAALAGKDDAVLASLRSITQADSAALDQLWNSLAAENIDPDVEESTPAPAEDVPEQFLVLITCRSEKHQAEVLKLCETKGLKCKALTS